MKSYDTCCVNCFIQNKNNAENNSLFAELAYLQIRTKRLVKNIDTASYLGLAENIPEVINDFKKLNQPWMSYILKGNFEAFYLEMIRDILSDIDSLYDKWEMKYSVVYMCVAEEKS